MKIIKKVNLKINNQKVRFIYFLDRLICKYKILNTKSKKKIVDLKILPSEESFKLDSRKDDFNKPIFYLKVNCDNDFSLMCLQNWINIVDDFGADFYIICDKTNLKYKILKRISFKSENIKFLKSVKNNYLKNIVKCFATPIWENAAYAHLTTFYHSKNMNYKNFWNIDADDTMFLAPSQKVAELLKKIEEYANKECIDNFSLDMHTSKSRNRLWSFGITYTRNNRNWFEIFDKNNSKEWRKNKAFEIDREFNIDRYFTWLRDTNLANNKIFYIDKCYFIHFGNFLVRPNHFGIYYWENEDFTLPILLNAFNNEKYGKLPIEKTNIKFQIQAEKE